MPGSFWRAAIGAAIVGGLVAGTLARVAMGILASEGGSSMTAVVGQVTLAGTLRILVTAILFGLPFSALLLWLGRWWSAAPIGARAAAYGAAFLVFPGSLLLTDTEFDIAGANRDLGPMLFAPIFVVYGIVVGLTGEWILRRATPAT